MQLITLFVKRYLKSKKQYSIINIISIISIIGVTVGTAALVIVLSVFNGFENLISKLYTDFNADIRIEPKSGKTINAQEINTITKQLKQIKDISEVFYVIEDLALAEYEQKQYIVKVKALSDEYFKTEKFENILNQKSPYFGSINENFAAAGLGVSYILNINFSDLTKPLKLYAPKRSAKIGSNLNQAFNSCKLFPVATFSVQQEIDNQFIIIPYKVGETLFDYQNQCNSIEINLKKNSSISTIKNQLAKRLGDKYYIKNRYEQQETLYKIIKNEKLAIFVILTFILIIATFNVIGNLSMYIIDKQQDISILHSLGLNINQIRKIFLSLGLAIVSIGEFLGLIIGLILCILQEKFGLIKLGGTNDGFIIDQYPVKIEPLDILIILVIVFIVGYLSSLMPTRRIQDEFIKIKPDS